MKKFIIAFCICFIASNVFAGAFDLQDKEANIVAKFMGGLAEEEYKNALDKKYKFVEWGGRTVALDNDITYLCWAELVDKNGDNYYHYFEVVVNFINDKPKLMRKYGLAE